MSLEIRSLKADTLAHELANATGEDIETAVERAIEERLARVPHPVPFADRGEIEKLFDRLAKLPVRDSRAPDEIMGYGPDGLPS
jgi:hypothetical protein